MTFWFRNIELDIVDSEQQGNFQPNDRKKQKTTDYNGQNPTGHSIVLAIVGQTVVNSTFVILLCICANVGLTFFKCPTIANTKTLNLHCCATGFF